MRTLLLAVLLPVLGASPLAAQSWVVDLDVDTDRDGRIEVASPEDDDGEEQWSAAKGAVFLYNNDDDNGDGVVDAEDVLVNGKGDVRDLTPVVLSPLVGLPGGWSGELTTDAEAGPWVRIYRYLGGGTWALFDPLVANPLPASVLSQRTLFAVEARDYAQTASGQAGLWGGEVLLTFRLKDAQGAVQSRDQVRLRVAPFLLHSNLDAGQREDSTIPRRA